MPEIRPFARDDRDQLTDLVNAHVKAIIPGCSIPVATLLSQMEGDPGEYMVDPWVIELETWVAIEADRLVAAVHLHRYGSDLSVGASLRDSAEVTWLVCWPANLDAGRELMRVAVKRLEEWAPTSTHLEIFTRRGSMLRNDGWADISNLQVVEDFRRRGIATWLLGHAAAWLTMGGARNLISYLSDDDVESPLHAWNVANGFTELNRTRRGWTRQP